MSRTRMLAVVLAVTFAVIPVAAQGESPPPIARDYDLNVKMGHEADFVAAMKKQVEWYRKNDETWSWHTWQWETGEKAGQFVFRSPGHHWSDMDDRDERAAEARSHFLDNVGPHLESMSANISALMPDLTRWPGTEATAAFVSIHEFNLHYGKAEKFVNILGKFHDAIVDADWPVHYAWLARVSGGEVPTFILAVPHDSWADMKGPDEHFNSMLEDVMGRLDARELLAEFDGCVKRQTVSLARLRPDLSYMPEEPKEE